MAFNLGDAPPPVSFQAPGAVPGDVLVANVHLVTADMVAGGNFTAIAGVPGKVILPLRATIRRIATGSFTLSPVMTWKYNGLTNEILTQATISMIGLTNGVNNYEQHVIGPANFTTDGGTTDSKNPTGLALILNLNNPNPNPGGRVCNVYIALAYALVDFPA